MWWCCSPAPGAPAAEDRAEGEEAGGEGAGGGQARHTHREGASGEAQEGKPRAGAVVKHLYNSIHFFDRTN